MEQLTQVGAIIGLINIVNILIPPTLDSRIKVALVLVIGAVSPFIPLDNAIVQGVVLALASSGIYKVGQVVSGK